MKFLATQITYFLKQNQIRQNINALLKYVLFLLLVITVFTVVFHFLMFYAEGRDYSWITGLYWTLTVMSTFGFGDITFESDIGRAFSILVLLSGIEMFKIRLPARLAGKTLEESRIGSLTGLIVLGIQTDDENIPDPQPSTVLPPKSRISLLGTSEQLEKLKMLSR